MATPASDPKAIARAIASSKVLGRLRPETQRAFAGIGTVKRLAAKAPIFTAGDAEGTDAWFYVLVAGTAAARLPSGAFVHGLTPGDVGGMTCAILGPPDATVARAAALPTPSLVASYNARAPTTRTMTHAAGEKGAVILQVKWLNVLQGLDAAARSEFLLALAHYLAHQVRKKQGVVNALRAAQMPAGGGGGADEVAASPVFRVAVFDTKPYDRTHLSDAVRKVNAAKAQQTPSATGVRIELTFLETKLSRSTAALASGHQAVCIFVNDACDTDTVGYLQAMGVRCVLLRCAGFNNVALRAAGRAGIRVARVPAYSPFAVAEHAFALLMSVTRRTHLAYNRTRRGNFALAGLEGRDLHGRPCGVVGTGKIGRRFMAIAKGIGMRPLYAWDPYPNTEWAKREGVTYVQDFTTFMSKCDVVSLHVPLVPTTQHLVGHRALAAMPKGGIVINTSRGAIVDSEALLKALLNGHLGGAGLDVYEGEAAYFFEDRSARPIDDSTLARLTNLPNVVLTAHQAFLTRDALQSIAETTVGNAVEFFDKCDSSDLKAGTAIVSAKLKNEVLPPPAPKL